MTGGNPNPGWPLGPPPGTRSTAAQTRAALLKAIEESARLARLPPTAARRARQKQLDGEKARLARLYRRKAGEDAREREEA